MPYPTTKSTVRGDNLSDLVKQAKDSKQSLPEFPSLADCMMGKRTMEEMQVGFETFDRKVKDYQMSLQLVQEQNTIATAQDGGA